MCVKKLTFMFRGLFGRDQASNPVNFAQLLAGDQAAVEVGGILCFFLSLADDFAQAVSSALFADGFCWLEYDATLTARANSLGDALRAFFAQDSSAKAGAAGYSAVLGLNVDGADGAVFKEKISLVSGARLPKELPPVAGLEGFVRDADAWLAQVVRVLRGSGLFKLPQVDREKKKKRVDPIPLGMLGSRHACVRVLTLPQWTGRRMIDTRCLTWPTTSTPRVRACRRCAMSVRTLTRGCWVSTGSPPPPGCRCSQPTVHGSTCRSRTVCYGLVERHKRPTARRACTAFCMAMCPAWPCGARPLWRVSC